MYLIEKCINNNVSAKYSHETRYTWVRAWGIGKSEIRGCSFDKAIDVFYKKTLRVRSAPYRLRVVENDVVLASINTLDSEYYKKYRIFSIGFNNDVDVTRKIDESCGAVVSGTMGSIVGSSYCDNESVKLSVDLIALKLSSIVNSHNIITRYNSDGESGGAWLVTSPFGGLFSNGDVGITFDINELTFDLIISGKYLNNSSVESLECSSTNLVRHISKHNSLDDAINMFRMVARKATSSEIELLAA